MWPAATPVLLAVALSMETHPLLLQWQWRCAIHQSTSIRRHRLQSRLPLAQVLPLEEGKGTLAGAELGMGLGAAVGVPGWLRVGGTIATIDALRIA